MNLDLLNKLVRLANNNPNDNEANLAARKVCRMIEEGKFNFNSNGHVKTAADKVKPYAGGTWNNVKRSTEPQWSSKPPPSGHYNPIQDDLWNLINKLNREREKQQKESYDKETKGTWEGFKPSPKQEEFINEPIFTYEYDPITGQKKPIKEKRILKCCICGKENETAFVGLPQVYKCLTCDWEDYEKKKADKIK
jgi:hypothetical protein